MRVKYRSACNAKGMKTILAAILQSTFYKVVRRSASTTWTNRSAFIIAPTNRFKIFILAIFLTDLVLALDESRKCWDIFKPLLIVGLIYIFQIETKI